MGANVPLNTGASAIPETGTANFISNYVGLNHLFVDYQVEWNALPRISQ